MDLKQLKQRGAFVPVAPVARQVEWTHIDPDTGEEVTDQFTVHIRRRSYGSIERIMAASMADEDRSRSAMFISDSILLGDGGKERISYEDAYQLEPSLAAVLVEAINEVNGLSRTEPKK